MRISSDFDGGNIEVVSLNPMGQSALHILQDAHSHFYQWFYFLAEDLPGTGATFAITNAADAAYPSGWPGYQVCASKDGDRWFRLKTEYKGDVLHFVTPPGHPRLEIAYFAPYPLDRHQRLVTQAAGHPHISHIVLGQTLDGRDLDLLQIGDAGDSKKPLWIIARQHPGETMAEWWIEGLMEHIAGAGSAALASLLDSAVFYIVPNMNPDGSARGHLRTNAAGINLNRAWAAPDPATAPEVALVRTKMLETGVRFHLDVHGDEGLPYNFIAGFEGIAAATAYQLDLLERYKTRLEALDPSFQTLHGYPVDTPGSSDLRKCTDWVAHHFGALAMTLEMPFKDDANHPDPATGWSPDRSKALARSCFAVLCEMAGEL